MLICVGTGDGQDHKIDDQFRHGCRAGKSSLARASADLDVCRGFINILLLRRPFSHSPSASVSQSILPAIKMKSLFSIAAFASLSFLSTVSAQSTTSTYIGFNLNSTGEPDSALYDTASLNNSNVSTTSSPDVFLNATVFVGEIDLLVSNLTAQVNLAAQVLKLLDFNAGVTASVNKVQLLIQNVSAFVTLEARLENLVLMIDDVLSSIDLNPVIATLGSDLNQITNATTGLINSTTVAASSLLGRSVPYQFKLDDNILYSVNNYQGNTHRNRILAQNGNIVDQYLNNDGVVQSTTTVGNYATDMTFNGHNTTITLSNGELEYGLQYEYHPIPGLYAVCEIYVNAAGEVQSTRVISEVDGGGDSTITGELKM